MFYWPLENNLRLPRSPTRSKRKAKRRCRFLYLSVNVTLLLMLLISRGKEERSWMASFFFLKPIYSTKRAKRVFCLVVCLFSFLPSPSRANTKAISRWCTIGNCWITTRDFTSQTHNCKWFTINKTLFFIFLRNFQRFPKNTHINERHRKACFVCFTCQSLDPQKQREFYFLSQLIWLTLFCLLSRKLGNSRVKQIEFVTTKIKHSRLFFIALFHLKNFLVFLKISFSYLGSSYHLLGKHWRACTDQPINLF